MILKLIKLIFMLVFVPAVFGFTFEHRMRKNVEIRPYVFVQGFFIHLAYYFILMKILVFLRISITQSLTIWKWSLAGLSLLLVLLEFKSFVVGLRLLLIDIKLFIDGVRKANLSKLKKVAKILLSFNVLFSFVVLALFLITLIVLTRYRYTSLMYGLSSLYEENIIYLFCNSLVVITGISIHKFLWYVLSSLGVFMVFASYHEYGKKLFDVKKSEKNEAFKWFMVFTIIFHLMPLFTDRLDDFGIFCCMWKAETVFACLITPALFVNALKVASDMGNRRFIPVPEKKELYDGEVIDESDDENFLDEVLSRDVEVGLLNCLILAVDMELCIKYGFIMAMMVVIAAIVYGLLRYSTNGRKLFNEEVEKR